MMNNARPHSPTNRHKRAGVFAVAAALVAATGLLSCVVDDLTAPDVDPSGITFALNGDSTLLLGDSLNLSAQVQASGEGPRSIRWSTSDPAIALATDGMVRAVGVGTATVYAQLVAPELKTNVVREVSVTVSYASIAIDAVDSITSLGTSTPLTARGYDVQGEPRGVVPATFETSDTTVMRVTPNGTVRSRRNGTAQVTASFGTLTHQRAIRVRQVARAIRFPTTQLTLSAIGQDTSISVEVLDASDSVIATPTITWQSSDATVLAVTPNGVIRALKVAPGLITVQSDTVTAQLPVTVSQVVTSLVAKRAANQIGTVGMAVDTVPTVIARDAGGNPVAGAIVTFATTTGNGQLTDSVHTTDAAGEATLGSWTLGTITGSQFITASAGGATANFSVTAQAGSPSGTQSTIESGTTTLMSGQSTTITLTVRDTYGNPIPTGGATIVFSLTGGTSGGSFSNQQDHGDGTYTVTLTGTQVGNASVVGASINGIAVTSVRPSITVSTGTPSDLTLFEGTGQTATVGTAVPLAPAATVRDGNGNPVAGVTVTFAVTAGNGNLVDASQVTDVNGVARVTTWTLGTSTGANAVQATWNSLTVTFNATATPGATAATTSTVTVTNGTIASGNTTSVRLTARDQFGNLRGTGGDAVAFATSGGASTGGFSGANDVGDGTYTATFTGVLAGSATSVVGSVNGTPLSTSAPTVVVTPGTPTQLIIEAGDGQTAPVGTAVGIRPAVRLRDAAGNAVVGTSTVFTINGGGGGVSGATVLTDGSGIATIGGWTLGTTTGFNQLKAAAAGIEVLFTATAAPGPPSLSQSQLSTDDASLPAGGSTTLRLVARDQFGNAITSGGATVSFGHTGGTSAGSIGSTTDNGDGSYEAIFIGTQAGTATTITASLNAGAVTSSAPTVTVTPGTVTQLDINMGDGQLANAGTAVTTPPSVLVRDGSNNPVVGVNVLFSVQTGNGSVNGSPAITNASGIATLSEWILGQTPGANSVEASVAGLTTTFNATGVVGPPSGAGSTVIISASSLTAGDDATVTLTANDAFGNPIGTGSATVVFGLTGGTSSGTFGTVTDHGSGTYTASFSATVAGTATTITATINGQTVTTTLPTITVSPGAPTQISVTNNNQNQAVGTTLATAPGVLIQDGLGNPVPGVNVTFNVTQGGGNITGGTPTTGTNGIATLGSWTLGTTPGTNELSVVAGALNTTVSATANVGPVSTAISTVSVSVGSITAGSNATLTLVAKDQYGNQLPSGGLAINFALANGTSNGTLSTVSDHGNGTYTATFSATTAGSAATVGATINASAVTSALPTLTVTPGAPTQISVVAGDNQTAQVLTAVPIAPKVLLRDAFNNVVSGVSVTFAVSGGGGSVTAGTQTTGADGTATVGSWKMGVLPGANALTASGPGIDVVFTATATLF